MHQSLDLSIHVRHTSSCKEEWDCRRPLLPKRVTRSTRYASHSAASHHSKFHPAMQHVFLCQPSPGCPFAPQLPAGKGRRYLIAHPVVPPARATPRRPRSSMANQVAIDAKSPYENRSSALLRRAKRVASNDHHTACQSERIPALIHLSDVGSSRSTFKRAERQRREGRRRGRASWTFECDLSPISSRSRPDLLMHYLRYIHMNTYGLSARPRLDTRPSCPSRPSVA